MQRKIKFRAWDKVLNKMITQENVKELLDKNNSWEKEIEFPYFRDEWYPAYQILGIFDYFNDIQNQGIKRYEPSENRFVLMQYTGLKDKNGKEIYEGDIVRVEKVDLAYIYYDEDRMAWGIKPINEFYFDSPLLSENVGLELEVIGNTYENKSLLED